MNKKVLFIDVYALAYRAYFAFSQRQLKTKSGEPTSAVYGFLAQFIRILEEIQPDICIAGFDSKEKTFRHEIYTDYKSNRQPIPEDLPHQVRRIKELLTAFNVACLEMPGYEADDIIGTLSRQATEEGYLSFIVTPDKDYVQLVNERTTLVKPVKSSDTFEYYNVQRVIESYTFPPKSMIDYLAILGDTSDAIPGVKGLGEKTTMPLIAKFGTVEEIYNRLDEIEKEAVRKKLIDSKDNAFLSKTLATIDLNIPIQTDIHRFSLEHADTTAILSLLQELEFTQIVNRVHKLFRAETNAIKKPEQPKSEIIETPAPVAGTSMKYNPEVQKYTLITTRNEAKKLAEELKQKELFVFDTETDGLDRFNAEVAGVAISYEENTGYFIALKPESIQLDLLSSNFDDRLALSDFKDIFRQIFEDSSIKKVCQNAKFDLAILRSIGIDVQGITFDTMLASYVLDPDQKHGMDALAEKYLNYIPIKFESLFDGKARAEQIFTVPLQQLAVYSAEDADVTLKLFKVLSALLEKDGLTEFAQSIEFALVPVLEQMERNGVRLDSKMLKNLSSLLDTEMKRCEKQIFEAAGEEFNLNSTKQFQKILFEKLGLEPPKKTKTGFSTDAQTLESLRDQHPIIEYILDYRQAGKLKSTYTDALPKMMNPVTHRVHTSYNQTVASTGRLSSLEPNLQNIPIRTEAGREIRKAFIPASPEHTLISADYSQIELRIMASMSGDPNMIEAFLHNEDIHRSTAALVFKVPKEEVTSDMRRKAKEVNFGIIYGIGAFGLKTRLGIAQGEAAAIIKNYFETFPGVKAFIEETRAYAKEKGYARTLSGRRRYLRSINSSNAAVRAFEERVAVNMPIQGTAADMIKIAMINIHYALRQNGFETKMILQVHDELVFDAPKFEVDAVLKLIKEKMETAMLLKVPVVAETGTGNNWLEAH